VRLNVSTVAALFAVFLLPASAMALPSLPSGSFDIFTADDAGGGWVIHRIPGKGDQLWGCEDVMIASTCRLVPLPDWNTATSLNFIHVTDDTLAGWLRVTPPGQGDTLMACYEPETAPKCKTVKIEMRPPLPTYAREWPAYAPAPGGGDSGGGGLMGGLMGGGGSMGPETLLEPSSKSDMWMSAGVKVPGPVNLYACRGLADRKPECELSIPGWLIVDRQDIGFKKIEALPGKKGVAIRIVELDEGSAAEKAGLAPGMVITRVEGFRIKNESHFKGLMSQFPATFAFSLKVKDEGDIEVTAKRKPKGGKKKK
jgi:hypothetical protein